MDAEEHLKKDPVIRKLIEDKGLPKIKKHRNKFILLCQAIISQQISNATASKITEYFKAMKPSPEKIINTRDEKLRAIGLSKQKIEYIKNVAKYFIKKPDFKGDCESIIKELTSIKGVGRWTAEMFLIFGLGHEDIFAIDDLGLRKKVEELYNNGKPLKKKELKAISEKWSPYRTFVSLIFWDGEQEW